MSAKIIAVTGATGAQGGGLARAILDHPMEGFAVRAITRDPESEKARALANRGAEVVRADMDNPDSIVEAFRGAYGAFCVTNFWEHFSGKREVEQARNMAAAAAETGVRHAIWSTFEDTRDYIPLEDDRMPTLQDEYKVAHFDAKAEADDLFRQAGVPTTFLYTSAYYENLIHFGWGPQRMPDGSLALVFPLDDVKMPMIGSEDIGKCAYGIFKSPEAYVGRTVGIAGDHVSGDEIAQAISQALGAEIRYQHVSPDHYRSFGFPGADDAGNMFQFKRDFHELYRGNRDLIESRRLNPELQTFQEWLRTNARDIPIPD